MPKRAAGARKYNKIHSNHSKMCQMAYLTFCFMIVIRIPAKPKEEKTQKLTYSEDLLSGKRKKNHGEVKQYYYEDTHPAIVSKELYEKVQLQLKSKLLS